MLVLGAILFLAAGTIEWPEAWVLLVGAAASASSPPHHRPSRSAAHARTHARADPARAEAVGQALLAVVMAAVLAMPIVAGLDACAPAPRDMPVWLEVLGAAAIAVGIYMFHVVMEHELVCDGRRAHPERARAPGDLDRPLRLRAPSDVFGRHLLFPRHGRCCSALGRRSQSPSSLVALFGLRAVWEENTLIAELPGYAAYAERVRYRLIPGLW